MANQKVRTSIIRRWFGRTNKVKDMIDFPFWRPFLVHFLGEQKMNIKSLDEQRKKNRSYLNWLRPVLLLSDAVSPLNNFNTELPRVTPLKRGSHTVYPDEKLIIPSQLHNYIVLQFCNFAPFRTSGRGCS